MTEIIYQEKNWKLINNPRSLDDIGESVRAVILENGDLYIENYSRTIHNDILQILFDKEILVGQFKKGWGRKTPSNFLTMQRFKGSNILAIGESNSNLYKMEDWHRKIGRYEEIINNAKIKHPFINFTSKLVGTKSVIINPNQPNII